MATTNLNIRIDKDVKDQAEDIFNEQGRFYPKPNIYSRSIC